MFFHCHVIKMVFQNFSKKYIIRIILCGVLLYVLKIINAKFFNQQPLFTNSNFPTLTPDESTKSTAVPWAPMFSHIYSCPVCFGYDMCNEVMKGSVLFHGELSVSHNSRILWKKGVLQTKRVLISSLNSDEWNKFDEYICRNASQSVPCNLSAASWKTALADEDLLELSKFRNLNSLLDIPVSQLALPICATKKFLSEILKSFDENFDEQFSKEEKILLLTSLMMQPGFVVLKLQAKTRMTMPFPNLLGACGRSVIIEGGLKPLQSFLSDSFDARAGLAVHVMQLVEDFEKFA